MSRSNKEGAEAPGWGRAHSRSKRSTHHSGWNTAILTDSSFLHCILRRACCCGTRIFVILVYSIVLDERHRSFSSCLSLMIMVKQPIEKTTKEALPVNTSYWKFLGLSRKSHFAISDVRIGTHKTDIQ